MRLFLSFIIPLFFGLPLIADPFDDPPENMGYLAENASKQRLQLEQRFAFDPYPDSHAQMVNSILQQISEGSGKLRAFTSYSFQIEMEASISEVSKNKHHLVLKTSNASVAGDVLYRDFSLERVLIPDKADLHIVLFTADGNTFLEKRLFSIDVVAEPGLLVDFMFAYDGLADDIQFAISDAFFYYDNRMYERFLAWANALESYYGLADKLDRAEKLIDGLNTGDPHKLLLDEFSLCDAEVVMSELGHAAFHDWLDIQQHDPAGFFSRYNSLNEQIDRLRNDFNRAIAHIDYLFYERGIEKSLDTCLSAGRESFLLAVDYNPFHIPSNLHLIRIDILEDQMQSALDRMGAVFELMHPHAAYLENAVWLADSLLNLFFDASMEYIAERQYTESLEMLAYVEVFCRQAEAHYLCPHILNIRLRQTHRGVYNSFLVVSRRAIRDDNLRLAATYLESAISYQHTNSHFIHTHHEVIELLFRVLTRFRVLYEQHTITGFEDQALHYKNQAIALIEHYPGIPDYLKNYAGTDDLATAVLNFAALSHFETSIDFLHELKSKGISASKLVYQQRIAGAAAARHYKASEESLLPGRLFTVLNVHDPWFREFRLAFIEEW